MKTIGFVESLIVISFRTDSDSESLALNRSTLPITCNFLPNFPLLDTLFTISFGTIDSIESYFHFFISQYTEN